MSSPNGHSPDKRRMKRLIKTILIDLALLGALLVAFAYFHHVRVDEPTPEVISRPVSAQQAPAVPAPSDAPDAAPDEASQAGEASASKADTGLLGGKYAERFTNGAAEITENSYRSQNVSITVERVELADPITYYVADIYIKDITSFRSAVAYEYEAYNQGARKNVMPTLQMATLSNALVAISGDNYTFRKEGLVAVRDGREWHRDLPLKQDICVLYYDGVMQTYDSRTTHRQKMEEIYAKSPYQIWSFGPALVIDGEKQTLFDGSRANPLSAVGYYEPGHYCFILVDGRQKGYSMGMSLEQLSDVFYELGCVYAYNLDGGDTAVMTFGDRWMNRPENGSPREVSDILYICEPAQAEGGGNVA